MVASSKLLQAGCVKPRLAEPCTSPHMVRDTLTIGGTRGYHEWVAPPWSAPPTLAKNPVL